ncbi:unnamed protein product [Arabidopsis halleri]
MGDSQKSKEKGPYNQWGPEETKLLVELLVAACNFDLEFIYVLSGWEGTAHDSKVLSDALPVLD